MAIVWYWMFQPHYYTAPSRPAAVPPAPSPVKNRRADALPWRMRKRRRLKENDIRRMMAGVDREYRRLCRRLPR